MELTCAQMDVLITFYIDKELSEVLRKKVEAHLKDCEVCKAKYDIVKSMITELKNSYKTEKNIINDSNKLKINSHQYQFFKNNLSAYIDNELNNEDNFKIKKYAINNSEARKELEYNYNIRKLMKNSFIKKENEAKKNFSKNVIKQLELEDEACSGIHPLIKLILLFTLCVAIITSFVLFIIHL